MTRQQLIGSDEAERLTPDPGELVYLLQSLMQVGICKTAHTMSGAFFEPTPWSEIMSWPGIRRLLECEITTMRRMSEAYANTRNAAKDMDQPWEPDEC